LVLYTFHSDKFILLTIINGSWSITVA